MRVMSGIPANHYRDTQNSIEAYNLRLDMRMERELTVPLTELADGGAGLICFGIIPVDRDNAENYGNALLDPRHS